MRTDGTWHLYVPQNEYWLEPRPVIPTPEPEPESEPYRKTFCPECGFGVKVDEEGLCVACGVTAVGRAIDKLPEPEPEDLRWDDDPDEGLEVKPEEKPCPNCQNAKKRTHVLADVKNMRGPLICRLCGRPESEWTYAPEPEQKKFCKHCQTVVGVEKARAYKDFESGVWHCLFCDRLESEWASSPDLGGIGG